MRLLQLSHPEHGRRVARVYGLQLVLIDQEYPTNYDLVSAIIKADQSPSEFISGGIVDQTLNYNEVYEGITDWKLLPSFDHPEHPLFCMLSGTGLTHKASAENRQKMHQQATEAEESLTDSMEMYLWGEEGGKPESGQIGVQPEWFFKGNGTALKAHGEPLEVPPYANDGGEEPEIAGAYIITTEGKPFRVGFTIANEFSDHVMEKKNYLYLAPSKLRTCAIGPELVLERNFQNISGRVSVQRDAQEFWSTAIKSGERNMSHSLANLEYHHFKYDQHRIPGMVHIHFYGADAFSFGENISLQDGDQMEVAFEGFGKPLKNPIHINNSKEELFKVESF